jgi:hypothetical protein
VYLRKRGGIFLPPQLTAFFAAIVHGRACVARLLSISHTLFTRKQTTLILVFRKALMAVAFVAGVLASAVLAAQVASEVSQVSHHLEA